MAIYKTSIFVQDNLNFINLKRMCSVGWKKNNQKIRTFLFCFMIQYENHKRTSGQKFENFMQLAMFLKKTTHHDDLNSTNNNHDENK